MSITQGIGYVNVLLFYICRENDDSVRFFRSLRYAISFSPRLAALDKLQLAADYAADNAQRHTGGQPDQNANVEHNEHREYKSPYSQGNVIPNYPFHVLYGSAFALSWDDRSNI